MSGRDEIRRDFVVNLPEGASKAEEERLIEEATDAEIEKLLDDIGL